MLGGLTFQNHHLVARGECFFFSQFNQQQWITSIYAVFGRLRLPSLKVLGTTKGPSICLHQAQQELHA